jgi:vacuolar-type H+-ATPase subunit E/Vma4
MTVPETVEKIESLVASGRVPGTSRTLLNIEKVAALLQEIKDGMPEHVNEAQAILRQKDAILKQAEAEAKRIRAYADEEATTIRKLSEEESTSALSAAKQQAEMMVQGQEVVKAAHQRAEQIIRDAEAKAQHILGEAKGKLNAILADAEKQAGDRRKGADNYAREVLFTLEEKVADVLGQIRSGIDLLDHRAAAAAD